MLKFILGKLFYGVSILFGVVTIVFFIFNLGSDPVENLVAENSSQEIKDAIRKKLNLDLPLGERYVLYLNDLSPLSIHNVNDEGQAFFYSEEKYGGANLFSFGNRGLFVKAPYLNRSYLTERKVADVLKEVIPSTAVLAILAITLALILGLVIGVFSALNKGTFMDHFALFFSVLGMSGPSFFMAIIIAWIGGLLWYETISIPALPIVLMLLFGITAWFYKKKNKLNNFSISKFVVYGLVLGVVVLVTGSVFFDDLGFLSSVFLFPGTHLPMNGSLIDVDVWKGKYINPRNLILPAITLGIRPLAVIVQLTRSSMLDELSKDYIRTARAKGLSENKVVFKHALKNALNPVITAVSGWFASLLAGAVFVEFVFGYRGLGMTIYEALEKDDMPIVMGSVIVIAATFVMMNFLVDILYGWIDPRVRS